MGLEKVDEATIDDHDKSSDKKTASGGNFLKIEPSEIRFTFESKKQISCYLYLCNSTDNLVAFKVLTSNVTKYCVQPNLGIILPQTTCGITVTMQAQKEPPAGMQCKDKFKIQSVLLSPSEDLTCITKNVFNKEDGYIIEEYKLPVVFLSATLPLLPESKEANNLVTNNENLDSSQVVEAYVDDHNKSSEGEKMSAMELLSVEPLEVKFPFEVNKQISSSLQLSNMTENYVAFKVMTTHSKKYCVRPNRGVMVPQSTTDITVTMQAQKAPSDTQQKDKFLIRSAVVSPCTTEKDINWKMFGQEGPVKDLKLRAVHTFAPQVAFPVAKESEEFSSCDSEENLHSFPSILGMIADFFGFASRSYHRYKKLR